MNQIIKDIQRTSLNERKTLIEQHVKLSEEVGELAQELLISNKISGNTHKEEGPDTVAGEAVDVILMGMSIFFNFEAQNGVSEADAMINLRARMKRKLNKWYLHQNK